MTVNQKPKLKRITVNEKPKLKSKLVCSVKPIKKRKEVYDCLVENKDDDDDDNLYGWWSD